MRLENVFKTSVYHWCEEVSRIVEEYSTKELQNVLPLIVDSLFEIHHQVCWGAKLIGEVLFYLPCNPFLFVGWMESENSHKIKLPSRI